MPIFLGFDAKLVGNYYEKEQELEQKKVKEQTIKDELGGSVEDLSKIEGILLLKQKDVDKKTRLLDAFDFRSEDKSLPRSWLTNWMNVLQYSMPNAIR